MDLDYSKLKEAVTLWYTLDYKHNKTAIDAAVEYIKTGKCFPEIGVLDTQKKIDAATMFVLKLYDDEKSNTDIHKIFCSSNDDWEYINLVSNTGQHITNCLKNYPEIRDCFKSTYDFYESHIEEIEFPLNNMIKFYIEIEKDLVKPIDTEHWYCKGMNNYILTMAELLDVFQEETGVDDDILFDEEALDDFLLN